MDIKWLDKYNYECEECKEKTEGYHATKSLTIHYTGEKKYLCPGCRYKLLKDIYFKNPDNTFYTQNYIPSMCDGLESEIVVYDNKDEVVDYYINYEVLEGYLKAYDFEPEDQEYTFMVVGKKDKDWWVKGYTNLDLSKYFPQYMDLVKALALGRGETNV